MRRFTFPALALAFLAVLAPLSARPAGAATPDHIVYQSEAETMRMSSTGAVVTTIAGARNGSGVAFRTNSAAYRYSMTPEGSFVVIRARADLCSGAPTLALEVDGTKVGTISPGSTSWSLYRVNTAVTAGGHWIAVRYLNDLVTSSCNRNAYIDYLQVHSPKAINTGTVGSTCEATDGGIGFMPPASDVSTTSLGTAPAYYETGKPTGLYAGLRPKGVMLVIHGGGWATVGSPAVAQMRPQADRWRSEGWSTVNLTYRACGQSVDDVTWFYDAVAALSGNAPICATGDSAGGHLALVLATRRPLSCVIARGGITDLVSIDSQTAPDVNTGLPQSTGPMWVKQLAIAAFGADRLAELSPALHLDQIHARVLQGIAATDPYVPLAQTAELDPIGATTMVLAGGTTAFVHSTVSALDLASFQLQEDALTATVAL